MFVVVKQAREAIFLLLYGDGSKKLLKEFQVYALKTEDTTQIYRQIYNFSKETSILKAEIKKCLYH